MRWQPRVPIGTTKEVWRRKEEFFWVRFGAMKRYKGVCVGCYAWGLLPKWAWQDGVVSTNLSQI
jgi:hypothetical protein